MHKEILVCQEIVLEKGRVWIDEEGICCVELSKNADLYIEDMKQIIKAQNQLVDGDRSTLLVDMSQIQSATREVREYAAKAKRAFEITASALIASSTIGQFIGNIYINFNRPQFPTRMFTEREEAVGWLKGFGVNKKKMVSQAEDVRVSRRLT